MLGRWHCVYEETDDPTNKNEGYRENKNVCNIWQQAILVFIMYN